MKFEGKYEAFRYTPTEDTPTNSVVQVGALLGVTRDSCKANDTIMAFMTAPKSVYSFPLATSPAAAAIARGAKIALAAGGGVAEASGGNAIGILWEDVAVGDTEALVLLYDFGDSST